MSGSAKPERTSATVLPFKLPPDEERFASRNFLIANVFLSFGCAVDSGEIDPDDADAMAKKATHYTAVVQAICEMPNEDIDELRKFVDALEWGDKTAQIVQYANDYIVDEWSP